MIIGGYFTDRYGLLNESYSVKEKISGISRNVMHGIKFTVDSYDFEVWRSKEMGKLKSR